MLRKVLAVIAALVVNMVVVMAVEYAGHALFPITVDMSDRASAAAAIAAAPFGAKAMVLLAWLLAALAASVTCWLVSGKAREFALVGVIWTILGVLATQAMIPHPVWMIALGVFGPIVIGLLVPRILPARGV